MQFKFCLTLKLYVAAQHSDNKMFEPIQDEESVFQLTPLIIHIVYDRLWNICNELSLKPLLPTRVHGRRTPSPGQPSPVTPQYLAQNTRQYRHSLVEQMIRMFPVPDVTVEDLQS